MFFPFGADYGALLAREEWPKDFQLMKKAGFNTILIGSELGRDLEKTDYLIQLASEHDIKVIFGLGVLIVPWHFFEEHPQARFLDMSGKAIPENEEDFRWPTTCFNNAAYRKFVVEVTSELVNRYKDNPAVIAWKIHNEPHYPTGAPCYCADSIRAFREWLKGQYKTVKDLNDSWGSRFVEWSRVEPPRSFPEPGSSPAAWVDWLSFGSENIAKFIAWQASIVRKLDPTRPVATNTWGGFVFPSLGQNEWQLMKGLDLLGIDFYPSWTFPGRSWQRARKMKSVGFVLDAVRCAASPKPVWVFECQAGPNAESTDFNTQDLRMEAWSAVAHGMKAVIYYRWDPVVYGAEPWVHYMRDFEGNPSDRVEEAGRISKQLHDILPLIVEGKTINEAAILFSQQSAIVSNLEMPVSSISGSNSFGDSYGGIYRALLDNHVLVDFLIPEDIASGRLKDYSVLFMPFCYCLNEDTASGIAEYVKSGGNVVAETYCAATNGKGKPYDIVPGGGLDKVFGCHALGSKRYRYWFIGHPIVAEKETEKFLGVKEGSKFWLCGPKELVEAEPNRTIAANFMEIPKTANVWSRVLECTTTPAIVMGKYGDGKTTYFAASLGEAYMRTEIPYLRHMVRSLLDWMGVRRNVIVEASSEQAAANVETGLIKKDGELLLVAINHDEAPFTGTFKILTHKKTAMAVEEVLSKKTLASEAADRYTVFRAKMSSRDCSAYHLF